ncbi:MAG: phosphoenolpyruvate--protein phosphotransferase [gamma proteobacterium symbiont of Bathyaustriella thionipta]|nr:phosphoenolpyruvate--protein phosphotransferase [gamma proteobacterium symbiont of Bathyaustriella thionipta]
MSIALHGIGIGMSRTIAIGAASVIQNNSPEIQAGSVTDSQIEGEIARLHAAVEHTRQHLKQIKSDIASHTATDIVAFIDTHLLMLEDSVLIEPPVELIRQQGLSAEWALQLHYQCLVKTFDEIDDPYLRTRKDDVNHVITQIQKHLLGQADVMLEPGQQAGQIVVGSDLSPADIILLFKQGISGLVIEHGGPVSHSAILARSLGIPAVVGVHHATRLLHNHDVLIIDADNNTVVSQPDKASLEYFRKRALKQKSRLKALKNLRHKTSTTKDKKAVCLQANIELQSDLKAVLKNSAEGVGLYRTEFLYMNHSGIPDENEHFEHYLSIVKTLKGLPLTLRTLDLGADKQNKGNSSAGDERRCINPALGLRAVRLCLQEPELFLPQLRAILRVALHGPVKIMIPMLSCLDEVNCIRKIIRQTRRQMQQQGIACAEHIELGGMIEVPAAALSADAFASQLDFLSIGTNDLIQYTLAVDRMDDEVNYLYTALHPAVLQLIQKVIDAGKRHQVPVSMCGEMAGNPRYTRLLLLMGLQTFSMQSGSLLAVKEVIRNTSLQKLQSYKSALHKLDSVRSAEKLLLKINQQ